LPEHNLFSAVFLGGTATVLLRAKDFHGSTSGKSIIFALAVPLHLSAVCECVSVSGFLAFSRVCPACLYGLHAKVQQEAHKPGKRNSPRTDT
jgi:hypothetical protein